MSTSIYPEGGPTTSVRTNLATNPHARGAGAWSYADNAGAASSSFETGTDTPDGAPGFYRATITTAGTGTLSAGPRYLGALAGTAGDVFTFSLYVRPPVDTAYSLAINPRLGGSAAGAPTAGPDVVAPAGEWTRLEVTIVATNTFDEFQAWAREHVPGPAVGATVDATMMLVENSGGPAGTYFDGSTEPTIPHTYAWQGTPDASASEQLEPSLMYSPDLVINYEDSRPTGVTVHETVTGGPPVIVRTFAQRMVRGTYEFFCATEELALRVANVCNGQNNVTLISDDVPGAPLTFTPTGDVIRAWNDPYKSWTIRVPYVHLTFGI